MEGPVVIAMCGVYAFIGLLVLGSLAAVIWAVVDCVRRQFPEESTKIVWIIVIVVLGLIGVLIYVFAGRSMGTMPEQYRRGGPDERVG
jgi:ABC-type anion transport system duplicated permease subunit